MLIDKKIKIINTMLFTYNVFENLVKLKFNLDCDKLQSQGGLISEKRNTRKKNEKKKITLIYFTFLILIG